jgi:outer membrane receptor protein involved in Fe transport
MKVLYGRAFRAPTARELLVDVGVDEAGENEFVAGNPDLKPEVIDTVESEVTVTPGGGLTLRGAGFYSAIGQEINSVVGFEPGLGTHFYDNTGTTSVMGGEGQVAYDAGRLLFDSTYSFTRAIDGDTGNHQYGVPLHMVNSIVSLEAVDGLRLSLLSDFFGSRPRRVWTPDSKRPDGAPVHLLHAAVATDALAGGRVRADLSIRNLLDTEYADLVYRNDANATNVDPTTGAVSAKYPEDIGAEGRAVTVGVEVLF